MTGRQQDDWSRRQQDDWSSLSNTPRIKSKGVSEVWGRYAPKYHPGKGFDWHSEAKAKDVSRLVHASEMVQTFVDALSGDSVPYTVGISSTATTAETDMQNHSVMLAASVILDPALSEDEAATLMVAYVAHEIGHIRYDTDLSAEMVRDPDLRDNALAFKVSNILRETRVERGFSEAFPGYGGLFEPMLRYISRETPNGSKPSQGLDLAVAATRYPFRFEWTRADVAERDWWIAWVNRWNARDDFAGHKQGVQEALAHLPQNQGLSAAEANNLRQQARREWNETAQSLNDQYSAARDKYGEELANAKSEDETKTARDKYNDSFEQRDEIRKQAINKRAGALRRATSAIRKGQNAVESKLPVSVEDVPQKESSWGNSAASEEANAAIGIQTDGRPNNVQLGAKRRHGKTQPSAEASAILRAAFLRVRSGTAGRIPNKPRGRLDGRVLHRIAEQDERLFTRRGGDSRSALRVYVLVDSSGSMSASIGSMSRVAASLADASRGMPYLHLEVYGWNQRVWPVWSPGDDPEDCKLEASGGTADASVMRWAINHLTRSLRAGERGAIIMLSDGNGEGETALRYQIERGRKAGLAITGLASGPEVNLSREYGEDSWTPWPGSVEEVAQPLATIIARAYAKGRADR